CLDVRSCLFELSLEERQASRLIALGWSNDAVADRRGRRLVVALLDRPERRRTRERRFEMGDAIGIARARMVQLGERRLVLRGLGGALRQRLFELVRRRPRDGQIGLMTLDGASEA